MFPCKLRSFKFGKIESGALRHERNDHALARMTLRHGLPRSECAALVADAKHSDGRNVHIVELFERLLYIDLGRFIANLERIGTHELLAFRLLRNNGAENDAGDIHENQDAEETEDFLEDAFLAL